MSQRLPRRIGPAAAKRMMLSSLPIDAAEAHRLGLADMLAEKGGFDEMVHAFATALAANSRHTNLHVKRAMRETEGLGIVAAIVWEAEHYPGAGPDHRQRIAAFSKR